MAEKGEQEKVAWAGPQAERWMGQGAKKLGAQVKMVNLSQTGTNNGFSSKKNVFFSADRR